MRSGKTPVRKVIRNQDAALFSVSRAVWEWPLGKDLCFSWNGKTAANIQTDLVPELVVFGTNISSNNSVVKAFCQTADRGDDSGKCGGAMWWLLSPRYSSSPLSIYWVISWPVRLSDCSQSFMLDKILSLREKIFCPVKRTKYVKFIITLWQVKSIFLII